MLAMIEQYTEAWDELTAPGAQFATTTIEVRGVPIKVFESAPPNMRGVWEMARGYGDRDYIVYEDERYTLRRGPTPSGPRAGPPARRRARRPAGRPGGARDAQLPRVGRSATGPRSSIGAAVVGMNAWWTTDGDGVRAVRLEAEGADRRRRARRARPAGARRAARRAPDARHRRPLRRASSPTAPSAGTDVIDPAAAPAELPDVDDRSRRRRHASSTPRAPPASRRARSSPIAARSTTCSTSCS